MGDLVQLRPKGGTHQGKTIYIACTAGGRKWAMLPADVAEVVSRNPILTIGEGAGSWVVGVINQRGHVIPVVDLAAKLGLPRLENPQDGSIIVTRVDGKYLGILLHSVNDGLRDIAGQPVPTREGSWPDGIRSVIDAPDGEFGLVSPTDLFTAQDILDLQRVRERF